MTSPTLYEFATLCKAVYHADQLDSSPGGWTREYTGMIGSSFWGARYTRRVGSTTQSVVAYRGTDSAAGFLADVGFGASLDNPLVSPAVRLKY